LRLPKYTGVEFPLLFTRVCGETVWKIAEGFSTALHWRQEAADRHSFDTFWPLSEPPFGTHSDFPNSFGRGFLRSPYPLSCIASPYGSGEMAYFPALELIAKHKLWEQ
jgi:hypothetical protein